MNNKSCIIVITFNISNLIFSQLKLLKKFNKDSNLDIIVVDNSNDIKVAEEIKNITINLGCQYIKTKLPQLDFSQSHAAACNFAYGLFKNQYGYMLLLDHDNFPVSDFSVEATLKDKFLAGVGQSRKDKYYFWPGCVMVNNNKIDKNLVDFTPNSRYGLDTGGNLYSLIEKYGHDQCVHFDQYSIPNPNFDSWTYDLIKSQKDAEFNLSFMHFINGSNWNTNSKNNIRIETLIDILKSYVGEI